MQKRFCDLKIGDKIYDITNNQMYIDTIKRITINSCDYEFYTDDQKGYEFIALVPIQYINDSTFINGFENQLLTTDIKVFLNGL